MPNSVVMKELERRAAAGDELAIGAVSRPVFSKVLNPKAIKTDARFGELGAIRNANGTTSTEMSITENVPELGGWVNIPTLVKGQTDISFLEGAPMTKEQRLIAIRRAIQRKNAGATLPTFNSVEEAVSAAEGRSEAEKSIPFIMQAR